MISRLAKAWFGDFSREELKKFLLLAFIFFFTIGVYWLIRITKDSVFSIIIGATYIPFAKGLSLFVVVPLVMAYGFLVDKFPRHRVFYALCAIYGTLGILFAILLQNPTIGLPNIDASPWRLLGWLYYVYVESFGSIMVALFWAFTADTTTPESAKRGYGLIAMGGQVGGIVGPLIVERQAENLGQAVVIGIGSAAIFMIAAMVYYYMKVVSHDQLRGYHGKETAEQKKATKEKVGFTEGLGLILSQPYLLGIFAVISIYEVIVTIFDFHFKVLAASQGMSGDALASYLGNYGVWTNGVALICLLLGVSNIGRKLGLTVALTLLPIIIAGATIALNLNLNLEVACWIMIVSKALNYALNQPAKEQLYIPTTKDAKYKAKGWIEMFGSRSSKAGGSAINAVKKLMSVNSFIMFSAIASLGLCGIWFLIALYLGRTHKKAVDSNTVVC
ncbi:MAG: Npt1/Npt2 family nucleotide transporter [Candidatus Babeliaceae bacterium]|jgi:AAA family ATP:ADP antiporter